MFQLHFFKPNYHIKKVLHGDYLHEFVGNEAKGRISKRVFQENKTRQIFRKTKISYPLKGVLKTSPYIESRKQSQKEVC